MTPEEFAAWSVEHGGVTRGKTFIDKLASLTPTIDQCKDLEHHAHAYKQGMRLEFDFLMALDVGATVYFKNVGRKLPRLTDVCEAVRVATSAIFWEAAVVLCEGVVPGFDPHQDSYDLLVLQLEGRKHWRVWKDQKCDETAFCDVLEPGDMLYVPENWWHLVVPLGHSVHTTICLKTLRVRQTSGVISYSNGSPGHV